MAATTNITRARWPRDLKVFAILAALWAVLLTAQMVMRDVTYYPSASLEAILLGVKFESYSARMVLMAQAMVGFTIALAVAAERRWGLRLALIFMIEVVASNLIFMLRYMNDLSQGSRVRISGLTGIIAVLILLYLWIRVREILIGDPPSI
jgi:hypothetical protein